MHFAKEMCLQNVRHSVKIEADLTTSGSPLCDGALLSTFLESCCSDSILWSFSNFTSSMLLSLSFACIFLSFFFLQAFLAHLLFQTILSPILIFLAVQFILYSFSLRSCLVHFSACLQQVQRTILPEAKWTRLWVSATPTWGFKCPHQVICCR